MEVPRDFLWKADKSQMRALAVKSINVSCMPVFCCPRCGGVSANPTDMEEGYCGNCHAFTGAPATGPPRSSPQDPEPELCRVPGANPNRCAYASGDGDNCGIQCGWREPRPVPPPGDPDAGRRGD